VVDGKKTETSVKHIYAFAPLVGSVLANDLDYAGSVLYGGCVKKA